MKKKLIVIFGLFVCIVAFAQSESDFIFDGNGTITGYTGRSTAIVIPERINGVLVTAIGNGAFSQRGLTSVVMPDSVTSRGIGAFNNNQLTSGLYPIKYT